MQITIEGGGDYWGFSLWRVDFVDVWNFHNKKLNPKTHLAISLQPQRMCKHAVLLSRACSAKLAALGGQATSSFGSPSFWDLWDWFRVILPRGQQDPGPGHQSVPHSLKSSASPSLGSAGTGSSVLTITLDGCASAPHLNLVMGLGIIPCCPPHWSYHIPLSLLLFFFPRQGSELSFSESLHLWLLWIGFRDPAWPGWPKALCGSETRPVCCLQAEHSSFAIWSQIRADLRNKAGRSSHVGTTSPTWPAQRLGGTCDLLAMPPPSHTRPQEHGRGFLSVCEGQRRDPRSAAPDDSLDEWICPSAKGRGFCLQENTPVA